MHASPHAPAFVARDVQKVYRLEKHAIPVLRGVSLTVPRGEWTALVGRSGSGKTTLLHLLGALDRPSSGDILCLGQAYSSLSSTRKSLLRRNTIGLVFQSYHLFPELNAQENVMLPAMHWGRDKDAAEKSAEELLQSFGLGHRLRHRPQELSGGEQQRVALARALINDPPILLADEPTGNLDAQAGGEIIRILEQLHREQGKTIIMVTHDRVLAQRADRILVMRDGIAVPDHEPCDQPADAAAGGAEPTPS